MAKKKNHIAHLTTVHRQGDPRIFFKELGSLQKAGYRASFLVQAPADCIKNGIEIISLWPVRGWLGRFLRFFQIIIKTIRLNPDLIHIHDPEVLPAGRVIKALIGCKVIYDMHENYAGRGGIAGRLLHKVENWTFGWVDHIVLAEKGYEPIVKGKEVEYSIILNYFLPKVLPDPNKLEKNRTFNLIYAGVQSEKRGLLKMIDLVYQLNQSGTKVNLHLPGICYIKKDRLAADNAIKVQGLSDLIPTINLEKYWPAGEIQECINDADIGIVLLAPAANYLTSIPTKFYEYLYFGLPILCSDFPLWRAFIEKYDCGIVVDPNDQVQILEQLKSWINNREEIVRLSGKAKEASGQFLWAKMEEKLLEIYELLLA